jgi:hypothetical protein
MRRSRGRLTLGVHKIPFLEFSPYSAAQQPQFSSWIGGHFTEP